MIINDEFCLHSCFSNSINLCIDNVVTCPSIADVIKGNPVLVLILITAQTTDIRPCFLQTLAVRRSATGGCDLAESGFPPKGAYNGGW